MTPLPENGPYFIQKLLDLGRLVRTSVISVRNRRLDLSGISKWTSSDAIYEIDTHVEPAIEHFCEQWSQEIPLVLIAEGIGPAGHEGKAVFPKGSPESAAKIRLLMDPIDGTRGLMFDKRAAWFLAGIAPNLGDSTRLSDIFASVMVELPTSKQADADLLWAIKGHGAQGIREFIHTQGFDLVLQAFGQATQDHLYASVGPGIAVLPSGFRITPKTLTLTPSTATTIAHSFASVANFFPGTKVLASRLMEEIAAACIPTADLARGIIFDDQYMSTGGQLYELITGHDRFIADLRPLFYQILHQPPGMSAHPYDLASLLIAQEAGVEITDGQGHPLDGPLDVDTPMNWTGFANPALRALIEPIILRTLTQWKNKNPAL